MTARQSIGGRLDYAALAQLHRPCDPAKLNAEIRRLHGNGLTARDIAVALRVAHDEVVNILTPRGIASDLARSADALPLGRPSLNDSQG